MLARWYGGVQPRFDLAVSLWPRPVLFVHCWRVIVRLELGR